MAKKHQQLTLHEAKETFSGKKVCQLSSPSFEMHTVGQKHEKIISHLFKEMFGGLSFFGKILRNFENV